MATVDTCGTDLQSYFCSCQVKANCEWTLQTEMGEKKAVVRPVVTCQMPEAARSCSNKETVSGPATRICISQDYVLMESPVILQDPSIFLTGQMEGHCAFGAMTDHHICIFLLFEGCANLCNYLNYTGAAFPLLFWRGERFRGSPLALLLRKYSLLRAGSQRRASAKGVHPIYTQVLRK